MSEQDTLSIHNEEDLALLRERARLLARDPGEDEASAEKLEVIEFVLAGERYGIESEFVQEVCLLDDLTPVPCTPRFVLGVVNIHGRIISVVDLRKFFEIPGEAISDLNRVVVLHSEEMEFGILADAVPGIASIPAAAIGPPPPTLSEKQSDFLKGVTGERLVIVDGKKLLSDPRIVVNEEGQV